MKYRVANRWFVFFREEAGVISELPVWVCIVGGIWLYTGNTICDLLMVVITQWKQDKHLVG